MEEIKKMEVLKQRLTIVNEKISKLNNYGVDLSSLCEKYKNVFDIEQLDGTQISEEQLTALETELFSYEKILTALQIFEKIELEFYGQKDVELREEHIKKAVKQIINNFNNLSWLESLDGIVENQILSKIYGIVYSFMKKELLYTNETNLFDYFSDKNSSKQFINNFMKEDFIILKSNFKTVVEDELDDTYSIALLGININNVEDYYNLDNLKLILRYEQDEKKYKKSIYGRLDYLLKCYENNKNMINLSQEGIGYNKEHLENLKDNLNKTKKYIRMRVWSIILSISLMTGATILASGGLKKHATDKVYKGIEKSYSSDYGTKEKPIEVEVSSNPTNSTKINVYSKVFNRLRTVSTYDVSDIELSDIKDYLDLNLDNMPYDINLMSYGKDTTSSEYSEVVITEINDKEEYEKFDSIDYSLLISAFVLLNEVAYVWGSEIYFSKKNGLTPGILYNLKELFGGCPLNPSIYKQYKNNIKEIEDAIEKIELAKKIFDSHVTADDSIKKEFNNLYNQYSYLLMHAKEYLEKFNEIEEHYEAKKLVRNKDN